MIKKLNSLKNLLPLLLMLISCFISCNNIKSHKTSSETAKQSTVISKKRSAVAIVDSFFKDFQEKNLNWAKTTEGHNKLIKAFEKEMTTNLVFAKACAMYDVNTSIRIRSSIAPYTRKNGEEGEFKVFLFQIPVKLLKPLYNGQTKVKVQYEIQSSIPSTVKNHARPYVGNANYCETSQHLLDYTFYSNWDNSLDLGCYIVTKNDNTKK